MHVQVMYFEVSVILDRHVQVHKCLFFKLVIYHIWTKIASKTFWMQILDTTENFSRKNVSYKQKCIFANLAICIVAHIEGR